MLWQRFAYLIRYWLLIGSLNETKYTITCASTYYHTSYLAIDLKKTSILTSTLSIRKAPPFCTISQGNHEDKGIGFDSRLGLYNLSLRLADPFFSSFICLISFGIMLSKLVNFPLTKKLSFPSWVFPSKVHPPHEA